ncbi:MAG: DUF4384 domain-containing protein [Bryobacteraceae bacterium]
MRLAFVFLLAVSGGFAQNASRMEITLERRDGSAWKSVDPGMVLAANDRVRFRFKSNFKGYLYVINHSTSGTSTLLFPRQDTGSVNQIDAGKEYVVPATQGAFRVEGPEGYDVISWMVSPVMLAAPSLPERSEPPAPVEMKPRCDDTIFKARGDCVDTAAGPKSPADSKASRELVFMRQKNSSVIASPIPLQGPVVYEFRLAHR